MFNASHLLHSPHPQCTAVSSVPHYRVVLAIQDCFSYLLSAAFNDMKLKPGTASAHLTCGSYEGAFHVLMIVISMSLAKEMTGEAFYSTILLCLSPRSLILLRTF